MSNLRTLISYATNYVSSYRESGAQRKVALPINVDNLRAALGGPLGRTGTDPEKVLKQLISGAEPGIVASTGPRYFGFVTGGALDTATAADIIAAGWDQSAFNSVMSPAGAVVEEVVGTWLKDLLGLPKHASFGLVTGAQGANTVALAAARHGVLAKIGWDVERNGLTGAPPVRVVASEERHATIDRALRLLGMGTNCIVAVAAGSNGVIDMNALANTLENGNGPAIVCLQAGNVNTGGCDNLRAACELARAYGAWSHVDGAFGLWAAASSATRNLVDGIELADSWGLDGHKWLNVPYDCGYVFCAHPTAHRASMSFTAAYLVGNGDDRAIRAPSDYVPESSRRARGFATWAALKELGSDGVASLVERCCAHARRFATQLSSINGVIIGNDVVLNQVLVHFGTDDRTLRVIESVQTEGTCWMGGTTWRGRRYMRISVSNWSTTEADVDRSVAAIERILKTVELK
jgi:glutamate/tyrosine decarboxylase-like PLP-dependent enzyme